MPKFKSIGGEWIPVTKFTKMELDAAGLKTLGQRVEDSSLVTEAPILNEDVIEESPDDEQKSMLKRVKDKRGIKSKKARVRV